MENLWAGYTLFITTIFIIAILFSFYLYVAKGQGIKSSFQLSKEKINEFSPTIKFLLIAAVLLIIIGFWMPFLLTREAFIKELDFSKTGNIGDTFGGILNPFVALAAVIVTGLAFYMQFQANKQVQIQFKLQQFESQFYEMLRLHKENVKEMEIENLKGRSVISNLLDQFHTILDLTIEAESCVINNQIYDVTEANFYIAYDVFFNGFSYEKQIEVENCVKNDDMDNYYFYNYLYDIVKGNTLYDYKSEYIEVSSNINITLSKHDLLGHYYRHVYMTVRYVVENEKSHKDSMKYLKVLRAQLSNSEQILLLYNWIAGGDNGYGANWENSDNKFFSKYKMIKNLSFSNLYNSAFIKSKIKDIFKASGHNHTIFEQDVELYLK